ncbi:molybdenum cofactor guanylyltransferase [Sphingomonas sp. LT1P40]|uniref:molybdenum cofactor guanylyltransferase n=1 Tax=Alteristakelama amylovorans TaxID=3096166 RepID=UPI002FC92375
MILGAILAGGESSRFGSDKALAELHGRKLIDLARTALASQCDDVVVIGRDDGIADWPAPGLGPLGGIAAALNHALGNGFAEVLTCGVDSVGLPADLVRHLSPAPAYVASQPVIGLWPAAAAGAIEERLFGDSSHSVRAFADDIRARAVTVDILANVNTREDLARLEQQDGL